MRPTPAPPLVQPCVRVWLLGLLVLLVALPEPTRCDLKQLLTGERSVGNELRLGWRNYKVNLGNISAPKLVNRPAVSQVLTAGVGEQVIGAPPTQEPAQEQELEKKSNGLFKLISGIVKKAIEPKQYFELIFRYHKWLSNYRAFQRLAKAPIPDAIEVLKVEYAREEAAMLAEEEHDRELGAAAGSEDNPGQDAPAEQQEGDEEEAEEEFFDSEEVLAKPEVKAQSLEFIFKVLKRLIVRLEANLKRLEEREGVEPPEVDIDPTLIEMDEEAVRRSMEGLKKSVIKSATNVVTGEAMTVARIATFNGLARYMETKADVGDALDHLRPIILLLGSATTPLLFSYLSGLRFRAAYSLMNRVAS